MPFPIPVPRVNMQGEFVPIPWRGRCQHAFSQIGIIGIAFQGHLMLELVFQFRSQSKAIPSRKVRGLMQLSYGQYLPIGEIENGFLFVLPKTTPMVYGRLLSGITLSTGHAFV